MASIGRADLIIVPKFNGLSAQVNSALAAAAGDSGVSNAGRAAGSRFAAGFGSGGGIAKAGALMGTFSAVTGKAMDVVAQHVGDAVSRLDTLKNYPQVMQSLGVGAQEAQSSITMMSDRLSNLPTRLDTMASTVQGLYAATKDAGTSLTTATKAGLALNDMLLSGGQGTAVVTAAGEQFRQMLAKGKPDMQDWRSLLSAAPGQMDQLAKSMLGATATTDQLYYALGGGNEKLAKKAGFDYATLSVQDLLDALIKLDAEGGAGLDSFQAQAEKATGGIQTAMDNMGNAVTKGLANVMDSFGRENIVSGINNVKGIINDAFGGMADFAKQASPQAMQVVDDLISGAGTAIKTAAPMFATMANTAMPVISGLASAFDALSPAIGPVVTGLLGFRGVSTVLGLTKTAASGLSGVAMKASDGLLHMAVAAGTGNNGLSTMLTHAAAGAESLSGMLAGPLGVGLTIGGVALTAFLGHVANMQQGVELGHKAVDDFNRAVSDTSGLNTYSASLHGANTQQEVSTEHLSNMTASFQAHADAMAKNNATAQETIGTWEQVRNIIDSSIGVTDLSTEAQGRLQWALSQFNAATGEAVSAEDVLTGHYRDQSGAIQDLKAQVDQLAAARIQAAKQQAYEDNLTESYKAQKKASDALGEALMERNSQYNRLLGVYDEAKEKGEAWVNGINREDWAMGNANQQMIKVGDNWMTLKDAIGQAQSELDSANNSIDQTSDALQRNSEAADGAASAYDNAISKNTLFDSTFGAVGKSANAFSDALEALGGNVDANAQKLESLSADQIVQLATDFDGTTASIIGDLQSWGFEFDDASVKAAQNSAAIRDALNGMGDGVADKVGQLGMSVEDFASKLAQSGVTAQQMSGITGSAFSAMADAAGGDMQKLIGYIENYNSTPIVDKDGDVSVDTTTLLDAQGNVYTWNGTQLLDKDGNVVVDGIDELTDAEGNIVTWNGQQLEKKEGDVSVDFGDLIRAAAFIAEFNGTPVQSQSATVSVNAEQVQTAHQLGIDFNGDPVHDQVASMIVEYASLVGANDAKVQYFAQQLQDQTATDTVTYDTVPGATAANQMHNGTGLTSFGATDSVAFATVPQAMGANQAYNGVPPSSFFATSTVESGTVPVATGNNRNYNAAPPRNFSATSNVTSNAAGPTAANRNYNANPPKSFSATTTITRNLITNTIHNIITRVLGGGNAKGGTITGRGHAAGAIFTGKTWIDDRNYIGENGAEYYDGAHIVPLTNRQYSQPFADILAEGITRRLTRGQTGGGGPTYNVYIDGARVNDNAAIESAFMGLMSELVRIKDMG